MPQLSNEADQAFRPSRQVLLPVILFILTLATTTLAGADMMYLFRSDLAFTLDFERYGMLLQNPRFLAEGLIFSIPLLLILMAHEMGHFLACEYYHVDATFPYVIPVPPRLERWVRLSASAPRSTHGGLCSILRLRVQSLGS